MNDVEQLKQDVKNLKATLRFVLSDRYALSKDVQLLDGRNIQVATATGTKIATAADQKLGFFGTTPREQWTAHTSNATTDQIVANTYGTALFANGSWSETEVNMMNNIYQALIGLGFIKEAA